MSEPTVRIDLAAEFTGKKAFEKALSASNKLEKNVKKLAGAFGLAFGGVAVARFAKASVKAFAEDDAAAKSLGQTLKNLGLAYGANVGTVNGFINRLEMQTGVLDDQLRPALDRILRATGDVTKSQELLALALDIAAGTGKSVDQVSQSLQKAYLGQTQALGRLGVGLSKAELSSSSFEEIQARLAELFAGQATRAADSYQGSLNKLQVAANNAKETIGKGLVDALATLSDSKNVDGTVSAIDRIAESIANATTGFAKFIKVSKEFLGTGLFLDATEKASLQATKAGTRFTTPMTLSSQDTQKADKAAAAAAAARIKAEKAAAAAKTKADKLAAAAKIKADKQAAENAAKLAKAGAMFDLDKIQIEAALKGKITDEESLRLRLQQAILNEDAALAEKLQKQLEASQRATAALQGQINGIKPLADPFAEWLTTLETIATTLAKIAGMPGSSVGGKKNVPEDSVEIVIDTPKQPGTNNPEEVPVVIVDEPTPPPSTNNPLAGLGGSTGGFGFSLPQYIKEQLPQQPVTVIVNNNGATIMPDELVKSVADALTVAQSNGYGTNRPGAVPAENL